MTRIFYIENPQIQSLNTCVYLLSEVNVFSAHPENELGDYDCNLSVGNFSHFDVISRTTCSFQPNWVQSLF